MKAEAPTVPNMKTGMKAPEGMGMVVETADIQNYRGKKNNRTLSSRESCYTCYTCFPHPTPGYLQLICQV